MKGKSWFEVLVPKDKYPQVWEEFISLTQNGKAPKTFENPILTKSGEERYISWQNGLIFENEKKTGLISFGIDITESKKAEETMAQLYRQNRLILNSAAEGILGLDLHGNHTFYNPAATRMLGYSDDEFAGSHSHSLWHYKKADGSDFKDDECPIYLTLQDGKEHRESNDVFWRKDGKSFPVEYVSTPIFEQGRVAGAVVTFMDITERKQSELEDQILYEITKGVTTTENLVELLKLIHESLKKVLYAENCFFALHDQSTGLFSFPYFVDKFDSAPQPAALPKSCTSYVFRTGKSMLITQQVFDQLVERNDVELVGSNSPSWVGVPLQTFSRVIGVLVLQHYEEEGIYTERNLRFLDSIGSQVANVIERKRAEQELEKSVSLLTATIESTADGILVVDKNGKTTNYNKKFAELWCIPEPILSTLDDKTLLSFILDQLKDPERFLKKVNDLYMNDDEVSSDIIEFKDGRTIERYSQSQKFNGKIVGRVWSFHNITDLKKAEKAIKENEARLHELNATKDKFFSIIAHDLKSPFNSIIGFSNLLTDQIKENDLKGIEKYAGIIQNSSQRAMSLITNLLDWSRSQTGRIEFNPEDFEIISVLDELIELLNDSAEQKSITILKEFPHNALVFADKDMISTVLRNLLSNAVKFTKPGGTVTLSVVQSPDEVRVSVSDNGVGMEKNTVDKLFRIDESYSTPGTQNEKGTGLGLLLCKEFIEKHGGNIRVESELEKGSTFSFTIPSRLHESLSRKL